MNNFIAFLNGFLSYLLVFAISVAGVGLAIFCGITWRKKKNLAEAALMNEAGDVAKEIDTKKA